MLAESRSQFYQLMQQDVGEDIALLQSLAEYQKAEEVVVEAAEKAAEARLQTKRGLNTGTHRVAAATQTVHNSTLGAVAQTESYKKVEEVVIENVVGKDIKQRYHFRTLMPEEIAAKQKELRAKFVEQHTSELSANTDEHGIVIVNEKAATLRGWYNAAMDMTGIKRRRDCITRVMTQYPDFTEHKLLSDYQHYLLPQFMEAIWAADVKALEGMCTAFAFNLRVGPYLAQLEGYERECSLLQVEPPMFVGAELMDPEDLAVEDDEMEDEDEDDVDDFGDAKKKKKITSNSKQGKDKSKEKSASEDFFEGENFLSADLRKLPVLTLAASTQVYECWKDPKTGKIVHGDPEVAGVMGHMWRLAMLPSGEWVIADVSFGSRSAME
uniref:Tim44-like domain-containing protein n=1 Tax=Eutreptiella gymnastica TaxID=73025 RepID=A0A6U7TBV4_9EUGL